MSSFQERGYLLPFNLELDLPGERKQKGRNVGECTREEFKGRNDGKKGRKNKKGACWTDLQNELRKEKESVKGEKK